MLGGWGTLAHAGLAHTVAHCEDWAWSNQQMFNGGFYTIFPGKTSVTKTEKQRHGQILRRSPFI